ncbi:MAG: hypothetical protein KDD25_08875, partial [Bdellovibrionales bacterium]|nr:hypothetical protein [Bdellovibrionales bacterium]
MSKFIIALVALVGFSKASAFDKPLYLPTAELVAAFSEVADWTPGDTANYNVDMGFFKGTLKMEVLSINGPILEIRQLIDMLGQKQDCVVSLDVSNGEIK